MLNYIRKLVPASVAGAIGGIVIAVLFGGNAGTMAMWEITRRWAQST
jgi:hypothetical protein